MLAACDSKRPIEVTGTQAERVKIESEVFASNTPLPGALPDPNFVQQAISGG